MDWEKARVNCSEEKPVLDDRRPQGSGGWACRQGSIHVLPLKQHPGGPPVPVRSAFRKQQHPISLTLMKAEEQAKYDEEKP